MNRHHDPNPFDEEEVNPFSNGGSVAPARPLASEPLGFGQKHDATVDIPLDSMNVMKILRKEKRSSQLGKLILKEGKRLFSTWCLFRSINHLLSFFL
ncbi:secretory carrier-associated membrane protein 4 [Gossypium australe]|uniref:Secretory carrier-associated membrane protein 4 n=1 Tax=Gossypium australe TaxID=47621 RepID=A0A5B6UGD4_9ROSI|nr:secretory carrier-associated membrane protein 4 [Gossypium australe]